MTAFIFIPLLLVTTLFAVALWTWFSHSFVLIIEDTSAGNDEVIWPDDPMFDWVWKGLYLGWVVAVWLAPAALISSLATRGLEPEQRGLISIVVLASTFWFFFPVSLLSTMSAESRWAILHFDLFKRLALCAGSTLAVYFTSLFLLGVGAGLAYWLVFSDHGVSLIVAGLGIAAVLLTYARLLGRLACQSRLVGVGSRNRKRKRQRPPRGVVVTDPWDVPEDGDEDDDIQPTGRVQPRELPPLHSPYEGELVGYDVHFQETSATDDELPPTQFEEPVPLSDQSDEPDLDQEDRRRQRDAASAIEPDKVEAEFQRRRREKPIQRPLFHGVAGFLFSRTGSVAWVMLSFGIAILGLMIRGLRLFWPL